MMQEYQHWDEYQWEDEIRRHEELVASFFQDLVYCLDLPAGELPGIWNGEAEMPSDPVSARTSDALRRWISDHEEEEEEDGENSQYMDLRRPVCFSSVDALDQLAANWNSFAIINGNRKNLTAALGINCAFAKLLARTADFTEPEKNTPVALQITLGKRAIFDLEELVDRLKEYRQLISFPEKVDYFTARLAIIRDQLIAKLSVLRRESLI